MFLTPWLRMASKPAACTAGTSRAKNSFERRHSALRALRSDDGMRSGTFLSFSFSFSRSAFTLPLELELGRRSMSDQLSISVGEPDDEAGAEGEGPSVTPAEDGEGLGERSAVWEAEPLRRADTSAEAERYAGSSRPRSDGEAGSGIETDLGKSDSMSGMRPSRSL